jgi:predicted metalloprotease with PDZ domain
MSHTDLPEIQYTVWPADLQGHRYRVKLHIANPDPEGQVIAMPAWIPGSYLIPVSYTHLRAHETG